MIRMLFRRKNNGNNGQQNQEDKYTNSHESKNIKKNDMTKNGNNVALFYITFYWYGGGTFLHMGKMLEDGKNVQSLVVIVLDVLLYNF